MRGLGTTNAGLGTTNAGLGTRDSGLGSVRKRDTDNRGPISAPSDPNDVPAEPAITRRGFLQTAAVSAAAAMIPGTAESRVPSPESRRIQSRQAIGLQLYTVRDMMERNVEFTLRDVAAIGYKEVEFAGLFDTDLSKIEKWLTRYQLTSPSTHISYQRLKSNLQGVVKEAQTLGQTYVVCPNVDGPSRRDADGWRRVAADFNRIGDSLQRVGLRFAYHNHDYEFKPLPTGEIGYDILLAECDPKFVKMEMDLFWIVKGGGDPLAYFEKWPGRFPLVHVKDMAGNGVMTNVGQGHIDWGRIFAKRREAGINHFFVEHDNPTSPLDDIRTSFLYMKSLGL